jgi:hypothetical protein
MKSLYSLIMAGGLAMALSVGAQTTTDAQQQQPQAQPQQQPQAQPQPAQGQEATTTEPNANTRPGRATQQTVQPNVQPNERERARTNVDENVNRTRGDRVNSETKVRTADRRGDGRIGAEGAVSHPTTVFRHGRETHESLALHRGFRDRADAHFRIGTHARDWWLQTYSIVLIDSCHYYLADDGCWYPAYGFDPSCNFPDGVVYCD